MQATKHWYQSRTVWGALIAIISSLAQMGDVTVTSQIQAQLTDNVMAMISAIGGLVAIYGRLKAAHRLG